MSTITTPDAETRAAILAVEEERQRALIAGDIDALAAIFDDSLVHIHAPGLTHSKAQLLEHVSTRHAYLGMSRENLVIRLAGPDAAIMTGRLVNRLATPDGGERILAGAVTQVLVRDAGGTWRFASFQFTPEGEQMWGKLPSELAAESTAVSTDGQVTP